MTAVCVVAPVHNEAGVLVELATRCLAAVRQVDPTGRVVLVDDASTDATPDLARGLPDGVHVERLDENLGQLGATKIGLDLADADVVVVLDGDLQDPPEHVGALVTTLLAHDDVDVVFASKTSRAEGTLFRVARAIYGGLARLPGARVVPPGVGAYCAMRRPVALRAADVGIAEANLAAVLVALGVRWATVPYEKVARYDGQSRIGALGLIREGLGSLLLTGALATLARLVAASAVVVGFVSGMGRAADDAHAALPVLGALAITAVLVASRLDRHKRRLLAPTEAR